MNEGNLYIAINIVYNVQILLEIMLLKWCTLLLLKWWFYVENKFMCFVNGIVELSKKKKTTWIYGIGNVYSSLIGAYLTRLIAVYENSYFDYWKLTCVTICLCHVIEFNWLKPWQQGQHFGDIFKCILFNENVCAWIKVTLRSVPKNPFDNKSSLVQVLILYWAGTHLQIFSIFF